MTALTLRRPRSLERHAEQTIIDFQGETAEITGRREPLGARVVVWTLVAMVVLAVVLAATIRLERVVSAGGRIVARSPTLIVQPLETSIIRSINVTVGQTVRRGDLLATLDPTFSSADVAQLERQASSLAAEIARLEAEIAARPFVAPDDAGPDATLQASVWRARQAERTAKLANFDQRIASVEATINRSRDDAEHYRSRLKLLSEIERMRQALERNQTGSRLNSLVASDTRVEVERNLGLSESTVRTASHELEAVRAEREVFVQQWRSALLTDLAARRVELERLNEELSKAQKRFDLVELRAVDDAVVLEVGRFSVGSVVETAKPIFSLVPLGTTLEVEAEIAAADQGFVKIGDTVQIKFDAYRFIRHGMARGTVRTISEDSFTRNESESAARAPYFRSRIALTEVALRDVPEDFRLVPGMTLMADIVVGERTILSYLLEGALRSMAEGAREP